MVNFEGEQTIAVPASEIVKILILQRRDNALNAIIAYEKEQTEGFELDKALLANVSSAVRALFLEISSSLKRKFKEKRKEEYEKIKSFSHSRKFPELVTAFELMSDVLDEWNLTRVDTRVIYDGRDLEEANKIQGF